MATLQVSRSADGTAVSNVSLVSLRRWLGGRWAILFSHPDDFVRCELELDRWLVIVGGAFEQACVRPLALSRRNCPIDRGGVSQLTGHVGLVSLDEPGSGQALLDLRSSELRANIGRMEQRFAMIIDSALRSRRTITYGAGAQPPSPLDLVSLASRLRSAQASESAAQRAARKRVAPQRRSPNACAFA